MNRPLHDLLASLMWEFLTQRRQSPRYGGMMIHVTEVVFDGLVAEGMRSTPPIILPFWSGVITSPAQRQIRVWQDDTEGFDVVVLGNGIRVSHTLTAHQRMTLAALKIDPKNPAP